MTAPQAAVRVSGGEGDARTVDSLNLVTCLAYTAAKGWHLGVVELDVVLAADRDADRPSLQPHGTTAAARRHTRLGTPKCGPCKAAEREYLREYRRRKKETL